VANDYTDTKTQQSMKTAICIASGPSLTKEGVAYCQGKGTVYVIKENYIIAPWADVLYAADGDWWDRYHDQVRHGGLPGFAGEKWTVNHEAHLKYDLNYVQPKNPLVWSTNPAHVATGGNSGFQAMNLAVLQGAERVILLGYDYGYCERTQGKHWWEEEHPRDSRFSNYKKWLEYMDKAAPVIPVPVLNATPTSAITCFPKVNLRDVL